MNKIQREIMGALKERFVYTLVLSFTLVFFLCKGFIYFLIGSYIPLIFVSLILVLGVLSSRKSIRLFKKTIVLWATLLLVWSIVRLLLSVVNHFVKPVPESHVAEQLGISGVLLSLLLLTGALYLLSHRKKLFNR